MQPAPREKGVNGLTRAPVDGTVYFEDALNSAPPHGTWARTGVFLNVLSQGVPHTIPR
jgi:hypothetical protein